MTALAKFVAKDGTPIFVEVSTETFSTESAESASKTRPREGTTFGPQGKTTYDLQWKTTLDPQMKATSGEHLPDAENFDTAMRGLSQIVEAVNSQVASLAARPKEVEVQFGVKIGVVAGAIIAKASGEANLQVTLKWSS